MSRWLKLCALAAGFFCTVPMVAQVTFYDDFNGTTAGYGTNANFNWGTSGGSTSRWSSNGGTTVASWVNAATPSNAILGAGTGTGAFTATLNAAISVGTIATTNGTWSLALGANTLTFNSTTSWTDALVMSGTGGGIVKAGTNTLTLSGTNTYTGVTTINAGTLSVATIGNGGVAGNLGQAAATASNIVLGGGNLQYTGATATTNRSFTLTAGTNSSIEVTNAANTLTISGASAATTGALTKIGAGTLTLSGANAYSGGTTVTGGTLIGTTSANAFGTGAITLNAGGVGLEVANNSSLAFNRNVALNANTYTLYADRTSAGSGTGITQTMGTLTLGAGVTNLYAAAGTNTNNGAGNIGLTFNTTTLSTAGTIIDVGPNLNLTLGALAGNFDFTKQDTGNLILNTAATTRTNAATTLTGGTLQLGVAGALGTAASALNLNGGTLELAPTNNTATAFNLGGTNIVVGGNASILSDRGGNTGAGITNTLGTLSIGANTLSVSTGSNTTTGSGGITFSGATTLTGNATFNVTNNGAIGSTLTLGALNDGGTTARTLTFGGNGTTTLGSAATSLINGTAVNVTAGTLNSNNTTALGSLANVTLSTGATVNLGFSQTFGALNGTGGTVGIGANTLTVGNAANNLSSAFGGVITDGALGGGLTIAGTGTFTLSNTTQSTVGYTGATNVNSGVLLLNGAGDMISQSSQTTVASGAALQLQGGANDTVNGGEFLILNGTGVANDGALRSISGSNTWSGQLALNSASVRVNSDAGTLTLSGGVTANAGTPSLILGGAGNINVSAGAIDTTIVNLTKDGTGTVTLSGANSFTGSTTLSAGTLSLANTAALGAAGQSLYLNGGTLDLNTNTSVNAYNTTVGGTTTIFSDKLTAASVGITHNLGTLSIGAQTLNIGPGTNVTSGTAGILFTATTLTGNSTFNVTNNGTVNGQLTLGAVGGGAFGFTKSGAGTLVLGGVDTQTGTTTLSAGTLTVNSGAALSGATAPLVVNGGTLNLNNAAQTVASLNGSGGTINLASVNTFTVNDTGTDSFAGTFGSSGKLVKSGAGSLTLSGNSTSTSFTGSTTLSAGTLSLTNTAALGAAGNALNLNGGTLDLNTDTSVNAYNTTVGGTTTILSDKATAASAGITHTLGTLSIGAQTLNVAAGTNVGSGTAGVTFAGATTLSATGATFAPAAGSLLTLGAVSGSGNSFTVNGAGNATITGVIGTGSGGITKAGAGTLTLSGTNTYTGVTTINGGTLSVATIGNGGVAGNLGQAAATASNLVLGGGNLQYTGATATTNRSFTLTTGTTSSIEVTNAASTLTISGNSTATTGGLTKIGAGTLSLSGANLYTGATTLNAGTLSLANTAALGAAGNALFLNGGTLDLNTNASVNAYNTTVGGTATILSDRATAGAGITQTLGTLSIGAQTLNVAAGTNVTSGTAGVTFAGATTLSATGATFAPAAGSLLTLGAVSGSGNSFTVNGAGNATITGVIGTGSGSVTQAGAGTLTLSNAANSYTGVTTVNGGILSAGTLANGGSSSSLGASSNAATNLILNGGTLQYTGGAVSTDRLFSVGTSGGALDASGGGLLTLSNTGAMAFNGQTGTRTLTLTGTGSGSLAATLGDNTGATSLTKSGSGAWTLTANNTYTGTTTLSAGTLTVNSGAALGGATSNLVVNGGTLNLNNATPTVATLNGTGGTINLGYGAGQNLTINGTANSTWTGNMALTAGSATLTTGNNLVIIGDGSTYANTLSLGANTLTINTPNAPTLSPTYLPFPGYILDPTSLLINSAISGTGGITKIGAGTLNLITLASGGSTFTGNLTITGGKVIVDSTPNTPVVNSNQIFIGNSGATGGPVTSILQMGQAASPPGTNNMIGTFIPATNGSNSNLTIYADGQFSLLGAANGFGNVTLQGGLIDGGASSSLLTVAGGITTLASPQTAVIKNGSLGLSNASFTFNIAPGAPSPTGGDLRVDSIIQNGIGYTGGSTGTSLTKSGLGTLVFSGASGSNTYQGITSVAAGILNIQNAYALGQTGSSLGDTSNGTVVSSGAQLQLQNAAGMTVGIESLTLNGTGYFNGTTNDNTGALLNAAGNNTWNGFVYLGSDSRINANAGTTLTIANSAGVNNSILNGLTVGQNLTVGGAGNTTVNGSIGAFVNNITKDGTGTLTLAGQNGYTGATNVTSGAVLVTNSNGLSGTGVTVNSGAALQFAQATLPSTANITVNSTPATINGIGLGSGTGNGAIENINGSNSYAGAITLGSAATIKADAASNLTLSGGIDVSTPTHNALTIGGAGNITVTGAIKNGSVTTGVETPNGGTNNYTAITGTGSGGTLTKIDSGTLTIKGANTSTLDGITLTLGNITVGDGVTSTIVRSGALSSSNASNVLTINSGSTVDAFYASSTVSAANTFTGTMAGTGTFQKDGAGTLVFNSTFSATGLTLLVTGGQIDLTSGASVTFGTIHITGNTILDFGGSAATTLSSANLIIDSGVSVTVNNWASETDFWIASGSFSGLNGITSTNVVTNTNNQPGTPQSQITFANWAGLDTAWIATPYPGYTNHEIRPIPEPATYGVLFFSGCLALLGWRRYSRRTSARQQ